MPGEERSPIRDQQIPDNPESGGQAADQAGGPPVDDLSSHNPAYADLHGLIRSGLKGIDPEDLIAALIVQEIDNESFRETVRRVLLAQGVDPKKVNADLKVLEKKGFFSDPAATEAQPGTGAQGGEASVAAGAPNEENPITESEILSGAVAAANPATSTPVQAESAQESGKERPSLVKPRYGDDGMVSNLDDIPDEQLWKIPLSKINPDELEARRQAFQAREVSWSKKVARDRGYAGRDLARMNKWFREQRFIPDTAIAESNPEETAQQPDNNDAGLITLNGVPLTKAKIPPVQEETGTEILPGAESDVEIPVEEKIIKRKKRPDDSGEIIPTTKVIKTEMQSKAADQSSTRAGTISDIRPESSNEPAGPEMVNTGNQSNVVSHDAEENIITENMDPWQIARAALAGHGIRDGDIEQIARAINEGEISAWPAEAILKPSEIKRIRRWYTKYGIEAGDPPRQAVASSVTESPIKRVDTTPDQAAAQIEDEAGQVTSEVKADVQGDTETIPGKTSRDAEEGLINVNNNVFYDPRKREFKFIVAGYDAEGKPITEIKTVHEDGIWKYTEDILEGKTQTRKVALTLADEETVIGKEKQPINPLQEEILAAYDFLTRQEVPQLKSTETASSLAAARQPSGQHVSYVSTSSVGELPATFTEKDIEELEKAASADTRGSDVYREMTARGVSVQPNVQENNLPIDRAVDVIKQSQLSPSEKADLLANLEAHRGAGQVVTVRIENEEKSTRRDNPDGSYTIVKSMIPVTRFYYEKIKPPQATYRGSKSTVIGRLRHHPYFPDVTGPDGKKKINPKLLEQADKMDSNPGAFFEVNLSDNPEQPFFKVSESPGLPWKERLFSGAKKGVVRNARYELENALNQAVDPDYTWREVEEQIAAIQRIIPVEDRRKALERAFKGMKGVSYVTGGVGEVADFLVRSLSGERDIQEDPQLFLIGILPGHSMRQIQAVAVRWIGNKIRSKVAKNYPDSQVTRIPVIRRNPFQRSARRQTYRDEGYAQGGKGEYRRDDRSRDRGGYDRQSQGGNWRREGSYDARKRDRY
ncbi:hypothetical protein A2Z33_03605 [Candidatus Gottesmanbacteria bacterium RBG_16_52_11]|uniref:Uncharacterized protein n=1 Tax=Candidatus Gottesmanbacteria bacterium RBG_16_52_11 TaxID=1798374 RepID=A0A1F5YVV8_9BACT|nr:MAG: hypothetical protein A2Z33_03605 [Candidatus Gottesmanbacteria bacterium RBG_16_52_11]